MRDRILNHLLNANCPLTSDQLLAAVLNVRTPNAVGADRVLLGIIGDDPRFSFEGGLWRALTPPTASARKGYPNAVALFAQRADREAGPLCLRGALYRKDTGESLSFELTRTARAPDPEPFRRWLAAEEKELLVVWSSEMVRLWILFLRACRLERNPGIVLCLRRFAARTLRQAVAKLLPESVAAALGLPSPDVDRPAEMARFYGDCLGPLLELVPEENRYPAASLSRWIEEGEPGVDFTRLAFGREYLRGLPETPGVYIMRNRASDILYVGKAGNLRRRLASYFGSGALTDPKSAKIHSHLYSLETVSTPTELDALLLETQMIRDFRPPVNLQTIIHERPAGYGKWRNLVLLAPRPEGEKANLYFLRDGVFEGQRSVPLGKPASKSLRDRVRQVYFSERGRRKRNHDSWEVEIVSRWLARHRRQINFVDIDDAGDYESVVRRLNGYLLDPDRLTRKVLYR